MKNRALNTRPRGKQSEGKTRDTEWPRGGRDTRARLMWHAGHKPGGTREETRTMTTQQARPFEKIATATLIAVVNRGRYARYGKEFEDALELELEARSNPRAN